MPHDFARHRLIRASAGSGKTTALAARIVQLLLRGAPPGSLLAVTFTRKAAAEIKARVMDLLFRLLVGDSTPLVETLLSTSGADPRVARTLYERVLAADTPLRATTFHAFCRELVARFPIEAGITPGFALADNTARLQAEAWADFERELTRDPTGAVAQAFDLLLQEQGLTTTRRALDDFLAQRGDWWCYLDGSADPVATAVERLRTQLDDGLASPSPDVGETLRAYYALLAPHAAPSLAQTLEHALAAFAEGRRDWTAAVLRKDGDVRALGLSEKRLQRLGPRVDEVRALQATLVEAATAEHDRERVEQTLRLTHAWYRCGQHLLTLFQAVKARHKTLDFTDLEWRAYRLLTRSEHAEWVQFKLDERIDHLLVDEFQDTNPTQWRLLIPLLEEMAAGDPARTRSVFLVGDEKQSIYGFRRADPRLFAAAETWLRACGEVSVEGQHESWRAADAVITFVNAVFADRAAFPDFPPHTSRREDLWGEVRVWPLILDTPAAGADTAGWRDPLSAPRQIPEDDRYRREGARLAAAIRHDVGRLAVKDGADARPLRYADVMVLVRDRRHLHYYEDELLRAHVPFAGAESAPLTDYREVADVEALLRALQYPDDALSLAIALKSPIFSCGEDDLFALTRGDQGAGALRARLRQTRLEAPAFAAACLDRWAAQVDRVPVHDLLDRIFDEADVVPRYLAAVPPHLRTRVRANLYALLDLALDVDSGRYPSLRRFLEELPRTAAPPVETSEDRVRVMTVHAAKGLEAPAVYLVDAASPPRAAIAWQTLVRWPPQAERPSHFLLCGAKDGHAPLVRRLINEREQAAAREDLNLLYVALTRARQYLNVSGCAPRRAHSAWYGLIEERLDPARFGPGLDIERADPERGFALRNGRPPTAASAPAPVAQAAPVPAWLARVDDSPADQRLTPSALAADADAEAGGGAAAARRGSALHRALDLLTRYPEAEARARLARERNLFATRAERERCLAEARAVLAHPPFAMYFDPARYEWAANEMPVLYRDTGREVYGVIDRLVGARDEIVIVDYKTHEGARADNVERLAAAYREGMRAYVEGVRRLWPGRRVRAVLLFTACLRAVDVGDG